MSRFNHVEHGLIHKICSRGYPSGFITSVPLEEGVISISLCSLESLHDNKQAATQMLINLHLITARYLDRSEIEKNTMQKQKKIKPKHPCSGEANHLSAMAEKIRTNNKNKQRWVSLQTNASFSTVRLHIARFHSSLYTTILKAYFYPTVIS